MFRNEKLSQNPNPLFFSCVILICILNICILRTHSFSHTRRQGNAIAYNLAKRARLSFPLLVWIEDIPSDIFYFVVVDFSFD